MKYNKTGKTNQLEIANLMDQFHKKKGQLDFGRRIDEGLVVESEKAECWWLL